MPKSNIMDYLVRIDPTPTIAPLMPSQDTISDQISAFYKPSPIPYVRHSPLPAIGNSQANAAITSISQTVANKIIHG